MDFDLHYVEKKNEATASVEFLRRTLRNRKFDWREVKTEVGVRYRIFTKEDMGFLERAITCLILQCFLEGLNYASDKG